MEAFLTKKTVLIAATAIIAGGGLMAYGATRDGQPTYPDNTSTAAKEAANEQIAQSHNRPYVGESGVTDTGGQSSAPNPNPIVSSGGVIKLFAPKEGQKLEDGSTVSGEAKTSEVRYRIKDNARGVIGQGSLAVVNGRFSGTLKINASGESGSFEIFSVNSQTGAEENNVKVAVKF